MSQSHRVEADLGDGRKFVFESGWIAKQAKTVRDLPFDPEVRTVECLRRNRFNGNGEKQKHQAQQLFHGPVSSRRNRAKLRQVSSP